MGERSLVKDRDQVLREYRDGVVALNKIINDHFPQDSVEAAMAKISLVESYCYLRSEGREESTDGFKAPHRRVA